jgi:lipoprotein-releasing system ATP-binding protein
MNEPVLTLSGLRRSFSQGGEQIRVLRGVDLTIAPGEIVALLGPSGAGKSTLLHLAGLLEPPDAGEITIMGEDCAGLSDDRRTALRRARIGFVYQAHHLLPEFTALENVIIPQMIGGKKRRDAAIRAEALLGEMGLAQRLAHYPAQLSGGAQQRVAIARALAGAPQLLLADEPTGNLDERTAGQVFGELIKLVRSGRAGALIATHNTALAATMDRQVVLHRGVLVAD